MSLAADPSIISFAGGMPNTSLFPVDALDTIYSGLTAEQKQAGLQYSPTAGYPPLLETLSGYLRERGMPIEGNTLIITTGAQQAINLVAKVLLDPEDTVVTEYPSFIGALAAFRSFGARLQGVALDSEGISVSQLRSTVGRMETPPKMLYINTNFHNPGGILYSEGRKRELIAYLEEQRICLLEDDPYGELYFDSEDHGATTPIKAIASPDLPICYVGSFSKIFGPGIRLGWLLAPKEIGEKCELAKQSMDACTGAFSQVLAREFIEGGEMPRYLGFLRESYARRARLMLDALKAGMPPGVEWTVPRGGFYVWVTLPGNIDSTAVFQKSLEKGAAFVIGSAFDPDGSRNDCFRLAFSHTPERKIAQGVQIVCSAVREVLNS